MKSVMVWNQPVHLGELPPGAHIGTTCLHSLMGMDATWWMGDRPSASVGQYDCYIVHLFVDMRHVEQIRVKQPDALIVVLPDAYFGEVFTGCNPAQEQTFINQLKLADVIGYISESNRQFYSAWGKPMVAFPMPIGTPEFFAEVRELPKEDFIITCDHSPRVIEYTIQNVAALALIQKHTGMRVAYYNPGPNTELYARELGLKAEFHPPAVYENYVRRAARARLGVDMYALHGFGRNELTLAYAGTPCVGSEYTDFRAQEYSINPWWVKDVALRAGEMLADSRGAQLTIEWGIECVEKYHSFDSVREKMQRLLQELEAIHADDKYPA